MRVAESYSAPVRACSGVPQGSVLGPILFLICVNDPADVLSGSVLLFADDVKSMEIRVMSATEASQLSPVGLAQLDVFSKDEACWVSGGVEQRGNERSRAGTPNTGSAGGEA